MVIITLTMGLRGFVSICGETIAFIAKRGESEDVCVCCEGYVTGDLRGDHQDTQHFFLQIQKDVAGSELGATV